MTTKIQLLDNRVMIKRAKPKETTKGGIIIPDTAKDPPLEGEVIAVGPGHRGVDTGILIPMDVKVGDVVLFLKYQGTEVTLDGEKYLVVHQDDVLGTLTRTESEKTES